MTSFGELAELRVAGDWLGNDWMAKLIEENLRAGFVRQHPSINASHEASAGRFRAGVGWLRRCGACP